MEKYKNRKPRYVREWYLKLKAKYKPKFRELTMDNPDGIPEGGLAATKAALKTTPRDNAVTKPDPNVK